MNERELNREHRLQRALERLGTNKPRCVVCGFDEPHALELHHLAGRAFDDETVVICRNHHRPLNDWQKDHLQRRGDPPSDLERIAHFLEGLADLFEMLVKRLREFAEKLLALDPPTNGEARS